MFYGWYVVGCAFLIATCGFGFGFYGPGIYLASLHSIHGWPIAFLSSAVAVYYLSSAIWTFFIGDAIERLGPRCVVIMGSQAIVLGGGLLTVIQARWQIYLAFFVLSFGWAAMNGAAISAMVAPWFDTKRGLAISLALNGGSCGGVFVTPLLVYLIGRYGFQRGMWLALAAMLAVLVPAALLVLGRRPSGVGTSRSSTPSRSDDAGAARAIASGDRRKVIRDRAFVTIAIPFVLGFLVQVGFLTHQISYLLPTLGAQPAAFAVSLTTVGAIVGRTVTGTFVDKLDRRLVSAANFLVQAAALFVLLSVEGRSAVYAACILFGLGVGNMNTLPPLLVQREFPPEHFSRIVSLVVSVYHFAFALGPAIIGALRDWSGDYRTSFFACLALDVAAAVIILLGRPRASERGSVTARQAGSSDR